MTVWLENEQINIKLRLGCSKIFCSNFHKLFSSFICKYLEISLSCLCWKLFVNFGSLFLHFNWKYKKCLKILFQLKFYNTTALSWRLEMKSITVYSVLFLLFQVTVLKNKKKGNYIFMTLLCIYCIIHIHFMVSFIINYKAIFQQ